MLVLLFFFSFFSLLFVSVSILLPPHLRLSCISCLPLLFHFLGSVSPCPLRRFSCFSVLSLVLFFAIVAAFFYVFFCQACNALKLKYRKGLTRMFTLKGAEVHSVAEMGSLGGASASAVGQKPQFVVSDDGSEFVAMALRKTAAERRADKLKKAQEQLQATVTTTATTAVTTATTTTTTTVKMSLKSLDRIPLGISTIIPDFLYLGSGRDAHTPSELTQHKITCILNVAREFPSSALHDIISEYREEPTDDEPSQILGPHWERALPYLESVSQRGDRVLVHCAVGKSRSAAFIVAYLMKFRGKSLKEAYSIVKQAREAVKINTGMHTCNMSAQLCTCPLPCHPCHSRLLFSLLVPALLLFPLYRFYATTNGT